MKNQRLEEWIGGALLHVFVLGLRSLFGLARWTNPRFKKAIADFSATYQFQTGRAARQLIFQDGAVSTRRGTAAAPTYKIVFVDFFGAVRVLRDEPNNPLRLLTENKIEQIGNNYYLFKFGYLCGLCARQVQDLSAKLEQTVGALRDVHSA